MARRDDDAVFLLPVSLSSFCVFCVSPTPASQDRQHRSEQNSSPVAEPSTWAINAGADGGARLYSTQAEQAQQVVSELQSRAVRKSAASGGGTAPAVVDMPCSFGCYAIIIMC